MSNAKPLSQAAAAKSQINWTTIRRWERYHLELRFKATMTKEGKRIVLFGQGTDVSEGGMAAYIPTELAVSDVVELELALPYLTGQQPLRIRAVVRNRNGFRYGLEYTSLASADREMLLKCLKALSLTQ
jgi:hypothetical protein